MSKKLLRQFRNELYQNLDNRADSTMDSIDALSGNTDARTVVELSLHSLFRRGHATLYDVISAFRLSSRGWRRVLQTVLPERGRPFWLFGVDVTSVPRVYAYTLEEREFVHRPRPIQGSKPVTIGHKYSAGAL